MSPQSDHKSRTPFAALCLVVGVSLFTTGCIKDDHEETVVEAEETNYSSSSAPDSDSWYSFVSSEGEFNCRLPGEPTKSIQKIPTLMGTVDNHLFMVPQNNGLTVYMVSYLDFPMSPSLGDTDAILESSLSGAQQSINGKIKKRSKIKVNGYEGRQVSFAGSQNGQALEGQLRLVLAGGRLYQILILGTPETFNEQNASKVFDSFQIDS